jgi:hypothetical protein
MWAGRAGAAKDAAQDQTLLKRHLGRGSHPLAPSYPPGEVCQQCRRAQGDEGEGQEKPTGDPPSQARSIQPQTDQHGAGYDQVIGDDKESHPIGAERLPEVVEPWAESSRLAKPLNGTKELPRQKEHGANEKRTTNDAMHEA